MGALSPWHIALVVLIAFLVFGVSGFKKIGRKSADRVKDTGQGLKGAAQELQASYQEPANTDSTIYQTTKASREKAAELGTTALDAAKEARDEVAAMADDARSSAGGAEPQTAAGRAARAVGDTARDMRAGMTDAEHEPESSLGKAAKAAGDAAKARVDMLGETANEFKAGVDGEPAPVEAPAEPAAVEAPPADAPPAERS